MAGLPATVIDRGAAAAPRVAPRRRAWTGLPWLVAAAGIALTLLAAWFARDRWDHTALSRLEAMVRAESAHLVDRLEDAEDVLRSAAAHAVVSDREGGWTSYVDHLDLAARHPEMSRPVLHAQPAARRGEAAEPGADVPAGEVIARRGGELRARVSVPVVRRGEAGGEEIVGTVESTVMLRVGAGPGGASRDPARWTLGGLSEAAVREAAIAATPRGPVAVSTMAYQGRRWWLAATPAPDFFRDVNALDPNAVLSTGLCLTGVGVAALLFAQRRRPAPIDAPGTRSPGPVTGAVAAPDLQHVIDALPNPLFVKSDEARWVAVNDAFCRLVGQTREALLGRTDADLLPAEHAARNMEEDVIVRSTGAGRTFEERLVGPDGAERWLLKSKSPIRLADGRTFLVGIATDITEQRRAEVDAEGQRRLLEGVLNALPNPVLVKGADRRWVVVNEAAARHLERSVEALLGRSEREFLDASGAARSGREDEIVLGGESSPVREQVHHRADGESRWILTGKSPVAMPDGSPGIVEWSTDITDRRRHEQSVLASRHRLQLVNELTAGVVGGLRRVDVVRLAVDRLAASQPGARVTFAAGVGESLAAERVSGGADLPVIGEDRFAVHDALWEAGIVAGLPMAINDCTRDGAYPALGAHLRAAGVSAVLEVAVRGADGTLGRIALDRREPHAWTNDERQTVVAVADAVAVAIGYVRASADREAALQSMREQEDALQAVIWATDLGVWTWDVAAREVQWSAEAKRQLGYADHELAGTWDTWESRVHPDDLARVLEELEGRLDSGADRFESEFRLRHRDGHWIHILSRARIRRDDQGNPVRLLGGHLDVTEFRRVQEALRNHRDVLERNVAERTAELLAAKNTAEAANRAKSEFLANMSHELRTPMHAILSFAQLGISRSGDVAKTRQYLDRIDTSGRRLLGLLNDLLDLSKLEAGAMQYDFGSHSVRAIASAAIQEFAVLAGERRIAMTVDAENVAAWCDPVRIGQVLRNLLSNSIRFTPADGAVRLTVRAAGIGAGAAEVPAVRVAVEDNGVGIPEAELETVFDKFVQSSKTRSGAGGTGLGLAICREIVDQHRGTIRAEATAGGGATIVMLLPREPISQESDSVQNTRRDIA
jgi:PAS domain S-box-containing protein